MLSPSAINIQQRSKELNCVVHVGRPVRRLSWTATSPSRNALTHRATVRYGNPASPHSSLSPWKHSCLLRPHVTSIFTQERYSSFLNMVLGRSTSPLNVNVLHPAVDWQSTVTAGCTNSSNSLCSCPQSWQLSNSPSSCDSSVASTFYPTFVFRPTSQKNVQNKLNYFMSSEYVQFS